MKYKIVRYTLNNDSAYYKAFIKSLFSWLPINRFGMPDRDYDDRFCTRQDALDVIDKNCAFNLWQEGKKIKSKTIEYIIKE